MPDFERLKSPYAPKTDVAKVLTADTMEEIVSATEQALNDAPDDDEVRDAIYELSRTACIIGSRAKR